VLVYRSATLSQPSVALPLPGAAPDTSAGVILEYRTANGGRAVTLDAANEGPSTLDVFVNFELEVNVERDLDRAVDAMNTEGPLAVVCAPGPDGGAPRGDEWMVGAGYAWGIDLFQSTGGQRYVTTAVSWGRDLTRDIGPGALRGRLMWAVEALPLLWQYQPTATAGIGISPLVWRWRFAPRPRAAPFVELAFGGLFTSDPVPEGTRTANFLSHGAFGVRWRPAARASVITAYRFQHISNGNQQVANPGVNAHVVWLGLAFEPRRRSP
jgi:hypothetical protein